MQLNVNEKSCIEVQLLISSSIDRRACFLQSKARESVKKATRVRGF